MTNGGCGHVFGHNNPRKHIHEMDFMVISHVGFGKNLNHLSIHYMSVML
jgi:hypothetical protein